VRCEQIMPEMHRLADVGFHAGELAVQHRAGWRLGGPSGTDAGTGRAGRGDRRFL
jgi:hypothetical protein